LATYYIDSDALDDNGAGTTQATAWKTIAKVNASAFNPGDSILFKRGCTWREQLIVPSSGSDGHPITFGAYGSGANPIINGSTIETGWTSEAIGGVSLASDSNLQGYWYFDNAWTDGTGHGNTLVPSGSPTFDNVIEEFIQGSYSAKFIGSSSQVATVADGSLSSGFVGKTGSTNTAMTVSIWVRTSLINTQQGIINKGSGNSSTAFEVHFLSGGKIAFGMGLDAAERILQSNANYVADTWYHIVGRLNSSTKVLDFFVNGVNQTSTYTATSTTIATNGSPLRVGYAASTGYLTGMTDEATVFNRWLSDAEVSSLYNFGLANDRNTFTAYYKGGLSQAHAVYANNTVMAQKTSTNALVPASFYWDSGNTRVYIRCAGDANPSSLTIEIPYTSHCISSGANNITFTDMICMQSQNIAISLTGTNNIVQQSIIYNIHSDNATLNYAGQAINYTGSGTIVQDCLIYDVDWGISGYVNPSSTLTGAVIQRNVIYNVQADGMGISAGAGGTYNDVIMQDNTVSQCALNASVFGNSYGIGMGGSGSSGTGNIIRRNKSYNNGSSSSNGMGIVLETGASNIQVYSNQVWGNYGDGINIISVLGNTVYNNSTYRNGRAYNGAEFHLNTTASLNTIKNNIFHADDNNIVCVDAGAVTNEIFDYNVYYNLSGATPFKWAGTNYNFANWKTISSGDAHSVQSNPLFVSPSDFHIKGSSPCINAGVDVGLTTDYAGKAIKGLPDIGAYEYSGGNKLYGRNFRSVANNMRSLRTRS
jgi:hypothetical protein